MIDPLDIIPKYGADALRLSMIVGQSPGADSRLYEEKIGGYRNFVNKLWNASRFVLMQCEAAKEDPTAITALPDVSSLSLADRAVLHESEMVIEDVTKALETYRLSEAGDRLYGFVWDFFCDWYLELSKGSANLAVLVHVLRRVLKLLHPYCPFVTEELWSQVKPEGAGMLIKEEWPQVKESRKDPEALRDFQVLIGVVTAIRKMRSEQNVEQGKEVDVTIVSKKHGKLLESQAGHIKRLGRVGDLVIEAKSSKKENVVSAFLKDVEVHMSLEGLIDVAKEHASLEKEIAALQKLIASSKAKLANESFVSRAPAAVVEMERGKVNDAEEKVKKMEGRLKNLA